MSYLSVSTWSLHRELGPLHWTVWDEDENTHRVNIEEQPQNIKLTELPAMLQSKGFQAVEICHFHFQQTDSAYLQELQTALKKADILLHTLLVDYGDISSHDEIRSQQDLQLIKNWIDIAHEVGAERVRVIAGASSPDDDEALKRSVKHMNELVAYAKPLGVRIITENFDSLASTANNCVHLVQQSNEQIGLITDFGNFSGQTKYEDIAKILPYSDSIHAKAMFDADGKPNAEEFETCLNLLLKANYDGPITLIYDGPGDMWAGIERVKKIVEPYL